MVSQKRKRADPSDDEADCSDYSIVRAISDDEIDISSALVGNKSRNAGREKQPEADSDSSDGDLQQMIQESIAKRNVKGGTDVLKRTKGKAKMTKGEVGGGSFQSMGTFVILLQSNETELLHCLVRAASLTFAFLDSPRLSNTNTDPASFNTCPPGKPTS